MKYLIVILFLFCHNVQANDRASVIFGGWSHHFNNKKIDSADCGYPPCPVQQVDYKYNEQHNFTGIKYNNYVVAKFTNSHKRESYLIAYDFEVAKTDQKFLGMDHRLSVVGGLVTGYRNDIGTAINDQVAFYIAPSLESSFDITKDVSFSFNTTLAGNSALAVTLSLNYNF